MSEIKVELENGTNIQHEETFPQAEEQEQTFKSEQQNITEEPFVEDSSHEEKEPKWLKKRLERQERVIAQRYENVIGKLASTFQNTINTMATGVGQQPNIGYAQEQLLTEDDKVQRAIDRRLVEIHNQQLQQTEQQKMARFNSNVGKLLDSAEDVPEVFAQTGMSQEQMNNMGIFLKEFPDDAINIVYKACKSNPSEVAEIGKLPPVQMVAKLGALYDKYKAAGGVNMRSSAPKPLSQLNTTSKPINDPLGMSFEEMAQSMIDSFKRK